MLQLHLSDQQFKLPTKVRLILEAWRYCNWNRYQCMVWQYINIMISDKICHNIIDLRFTCWPWPVLNLTLKWETISRYCDILEQHCDNSSVIAMQLSILHWIINLTSWSSNILQVSDFLDHILYAWKQGRSFEYVLISVIWFLYDNFMLIKTM